MPPIKMNKIIKKMLLQKLFKLYRLYVYYIYINTDNGFFGHIEII